MVQSIYIYDTQLYIAVDKATVTSASTTITAGTTAIYEWLLHNCLALNPDKSESVSPRHCHQNWTAPRCRLS